ncbi:MAG: cytochrome c oxidase assembly protein [Burkholderiales bacterium]
MQTADDNVQMQNRAMLRKLLVISLMMLGFGFALVPFYKKICEVTGINQLRTAQVIPANTQVDLSRDIKVEFLATTNQNMPLEFTPLHSGINLHPGQLVTVNYRVVNKTDRTLVAQAVPSFSPELAGKYFIKQNCFCFTRQTFAPHEVREMPVTFVVKNDVPDDMRTISLSYTFFDVTAEETKS